MAYPAGIESFTTKTNNVDTIDASHVNALQTSVVNIETELGVNPAGDYADVVTRLDTMETAIDESWITDTKTWTYAGANSFTVAANVTSYLMTGTKIRLKDAGGAYEYYSVVSSSYSSPNTTVVITAGVDNNLSGGALTYTAYSNQLIATGFPEQFSWDGTTGINAQGYSSVGSQFCKFFIVGRMVFMRISITGTSNATTLTGTLPFAPSAVLQLPIKARNNTTDYSWGEASLDTSTTITFYKDTAESAWATSNTKAVGPTLISFYI